MMGDIRGGLSLGLSGFPFYATDVGGFYKDRRDPRPVRALVPGGGVFRPHAPARHRRAGAVVVWRGG